MPVTDSFTTWRSAIATRSGVSLLVVGVRNVFDETPPVLGWGGFNPSVSTNVNYNIPLGAGYSLLDRRIFATFSYDLSSIF